MIYKTNPLLQSKFVGPATSILPFFFGYIKNLVMQSCKHKARFEKKTRKKEDMASNSITTPTPALLKVAALCGSLRRASRNRGLIRCGLSLSLKITIFSLLNHSPSGYS